MKMKAIIAAIAVAVTLTASAATAQNDGVITVKVNKASKALVEKWLEGYKAVNPDVQIALVSGKNADADLTLVNQHQEGVNVTYVGRYALLPVTSTENPLLNDIQKKEWKSKDIKNLFFTAEDLDEEYEEEVEGKHNKLKDKLTVYSGSSKTSLSDIFASHFGRTIDDLRGRQGFGHVQRTEQPLRPLFTHTPQRPRAAAPQCEGKPTRGTPFGQPRRDTPTD